jgi:hypothetical protein
LWNAIAADRPHVPLARRVLEVLVLLVRVDELVRHRDAVDVHDIAADLDGIAGERDHALDVVAIRIARIDEDDHLAALGAAHLEELRRRVRDPHAVDELVDEDVVADLERRIHRRARDLERLDHERAQRERDQHGGADRLDVVARRRLRGLLDQLVAQRVEQRQVAAHAVEVAVGEAAFDLARDGVEIAGLAAQALLQGQRGARLAHERSRLLPDAPIERGRAHQSTFRTVKNASCGSSTEPTDFMRFLPSFCFSRSFFLRVMSPP